MICCFMVMASHVLRAPFASTANAMAIRFFISDNLPLSALIHRVNMPDIAHFNPLRVAKAKDRHTDTQWKINFLPMSVFVFHLNRAS